MMRQTKYNHLTLSGIFPDKVISVIGFTDDTVVHFDVPVVKNNLQMMVTYK